MPSDVAEIVVCREHRHVVANAELRQDGIDGADLDPCAATAIAQFSGLDVVFATGG